jgi:hypothetical protein
MTTTTPCYRHSRQVWLAACPDCTAWHLAAACARRDAAAAVSPVGRVRPAPRPAADVPPIALLDAA